MMRAAPLARLNHERKHGLNMLKKIWLIGNLLRADQALSPVDKRWKLGWLGAFDMFEAVGAGVPQNEAQSEWLRILSEAMSRRGGQTHADHLLETNPEFDRTDAVLLVPDAVTPEG